MAPNHREPLTRQETFWITFWAISALAIFFLVFKAGVWTERARAESIHVELNRASASKTPCL